MGNNGSGNNHPTGKFLVVGFVFATIVLFCFLSACGGGGGVTTNNLAPSKPANLLPANGTVDLGTTPILEWEASEDPENDMLTYIVLYSTDTINRSTAKTVIATQTTVELEDLTPGTWWWRVIVVDRGNNMVRGDRWSFTVGSSNLPTTDILNFDPDMIVVDISENGVSLSWPEYYDQENPGSPVVYDLRLDDPTSLSSARVHSIDSLLSLESRYLEVASTTSETSVMLNGLNGGTRFDGSLVARSASNTQTPISYFSFYTGNSLPSTPVYLFPDNGWVHVSPSASLSWYPSEDEDGDPVDYEIYLGSDRDTAQRYSREATPLSYTPVQNLINGEIYTWRVVAKDDRGGNRTGEWWQFSVGNATPTSLTAVSPTHRATNVSINTTLGWDCEDLESDTLSFALWFGTTSSGLSLIDDTITSPEYEFEDALLYAKKYYWKITVNDGQNTSKRAIAESAVWEFTTEATPNYAPEKPTLTAPLNNAVDVSTSPVLSWNCKDDNPEDTLTYSIYTGSTADNLTLKKKTTVSSYKLTGLSYVTKYYWKVVADDGRESTERSTSASDVWCFTTQATPNFAPGKPFNPNPADNATDVALSPVLSWECTDANQDVLEFVVAWGTDSGSLTQTATTTSFTYNLTGLSTGTIYYWKVTADDKKGHSERLITEGDVWQFETKETE
jgi:hypothetical protein